VFVLAEYEEMSLEEIARAVDANVGTVKARLHRARVNLRGMLAPVLGNQVRLKADTTMGTKRVG
jgi:DNA-directed RNA polymerase specialized sigma24 family protein